jgi:hypothetical protein
MASLNPPPPTIVIPFLNPKPNMGLNAKVWSSKFINWWPQIKTKLPQGRWLSGIALFGNSKKKKGFRVQTSLCACDERKPCYDPLSFTGGVPTACPSGQVWWLCFQNWKIQIKKTPFTLWKPLHNQIKKQMWVGLILVAGLDGSNGL